MFRFTGALATFPTVTTTCRKVPGIALAGTWKLTCVTPIDQLGMPMNTGVIFVQPTVIKNGCTGFGITFGAGVDPVVGAGD